MTRPADHPALYPAPHPASCPPTAPPVPYAPGRAAVAEVLVRRAVRELPLRVRLPDGRCWGAGGPHTPTLRLVRPRSFFHRLGAQANIGFGESYLAGDWHATGDLAELLAVFAARLADLMPPTPRWLLRRVLPGPPTAEENTVEGARRNIHRHYDLPAELFAAFLDESMSYSAGWFADGPDDLATAQQRKIDRVLDLAAVGPGQRVLEIGTGWGALAVAAARRGAQVTTVTLSGEQRRAATERVARAGVADRVEVLLRDYREVTGRYDAVLSVEMVEAVGARYWPAYFTALDRLLAPGGRIGLQTITMGHDRLRATQGGYNWIHKYVFPGGLIPSVTAIEDTLAEHTSLRITADDRFGADYARTLGHWRRRFVASWPGLAAHGFDPGFRRLWEFYLAYSEAGFRTGYLDVHQLRMERR